MIRSFKDLNSQPQTFPDIKLQQKLRKDFPQKTIDTINKALIITNNSYDLSSALLNSGCKLDANRFDTCNDHQVDSDYVNIILYKNGICISDKFLSYNESKNRDILKMIRRGEIDTELIGNENDGYVKLIDRSEIVYSETNTKNKEEKSNKEKDIAKEDLKNKDIKDLKNKDVKEEKEKRKGFTLGELRRQQKKDF